MAMNIPNLPTESLYKFLALAGLVICGLSLLLPSWASESFELELLNLHRENDLYRLERSSLDQKVGHVNSEWNRVISSLETSQERESVRLDEMRRELALLEEEDARTMAALEAGQIASLEEEMQEMNERLARSDALGVEAQGMIDADGSDEFRKLDELRKERHSIFSDWIRETSRLRTAMNHADGRVDHLLNRLNTMLLVMTIGMPLGFILSAFGFRLWYTKQQVYQDQILKHQAEQISQEKTDQPRAENEKA